jgi:hypothetical protein
MDKEFIELAEKIADDRGKDVFFNPKLVKALFMDYGRGEYKNEVNLLVRIIELGYAKKIIDSEDINITEMILIRQLLEEQFLNENIAESIIKLLIGLLCNKEYLREIDKNNIIHEKNIYVNRDLETKVLQNINPISKPKIADNNYLSTSVIHIGEWTCKKCDQINSETSIICKGCGEYKPSPTLGRTLANKNPIIINNNKNLKINSSRNDSTIICFNCKREFNITVKEEDFKETKCIYCQKKITLKNVMFK